MTSSSASIPAEDQLEGFQEVLGRGKRTRNLERMNALIQAEGELEDEHPHRSHHRPRRAPKKHVVTTATIDDNNFFSSLPVEETSDADDDDFTTEMASELSSESSSEIDTVEVISNKELAMILPTKTVPSRGGRTTRPNVRHPRKNISKRKSAAVGSSTAPQPSKRARVEEVDDVDDPSPQLLSVHQVLKHSKSRVLKNPIYLFYEEVSMNSSGVEGNQGDKHYKCYHGQRKILTITKAMRSSLNGLVGHVKNHFPAMFRLYLHLKLRAEPPTEEEIAIASGKKILDPTKATEYLLKLERSSSNIIDAFNDQNQRAAQANWDQETFERLLTEWMVACDQPFEEVNQPEFRRLLEYTHLQPSLHIPHRQSVKRRVMKMGEDTVNDVKKMVEELDCKVSISLDGWTSSNQYGFLAIVMHYITNTWKLEELLIDFRELVGEHSGHNMAQAVFDTMELLGLKDRILAIMADNASNNDTMCRVLQELCEKDGIIFNAQHARLRCMPHTIHLSALVLLESIHCGNEKMVRPS